MPGSHSPLKKLFSIQLPQRTYRQLEKEADAQDKPVMRLIDEIITDAVGGVILTPADEALILERIKTVLEKRVTKRGAK